jgi:[ribosomal protein S18]-alanine N-acetyltransferase
LNAQTLVYEQFDWWSLEELAPHVLLLPDKAAGLCIAPIDLSTTPGASSLGAWVRWAAVADNASPRALAHLFEQHSIRLRALAVRSLWAVCQRGSWLIRHLREAGFQKTDEIITLDHRRALGAIAMPEGVQLYDATDADLDAIDALDRVSFVPQWRYPRMLLTRVLSCSHIFKIAKYEGTIAGYQCATLESAAAHIIRLAVLPEFRKRGLGRVLLSSAVETLYAAGAKRVTINTPKSFTAIDLYRAVGFRPLLDVADVFTREI